VEITQKIKNTKKSSFCANQDSVLVALITIKARNEKYTRKFCVAFRFVRDSKYT
jgi:hypothetical protein